MIIFVYDLYHFIIPDSMTLSLLILSVVILGYKSYFLASSSETVLLTLGAALGASAFFLILWLVSKGAWLGFGDVKLAFPLALLVGSEYVFSLVVLAFWVGAIISLGLLAIARLNRGKAHLHLAGSALTMKSAVPFAPFLVASCLIILFTKLNVLELFSFI